MRRIAPLLVVGMLCGMVLGAVLGAAPASAAKPSDPFTTSSYRGASCSLSKSSFFGFPTWYKYLEGSKAGRGSDVSCRPYVSKATDLWLIVAAAFEMIIRAAGIVAVGFVIWGGFLYITSQGQPDKISNGKNTITNALIGLVLTIVSTRLIGFIAGRFSGGTNAQLLLPDVSAGTGAIHTVVNIAFQLAAGISIIFVIYGGITYARSSGDPGAMKQAKETITYSLVGLALIVFAEAIINFVISRVT